MVPSFVGSVDIIISGVLSINQGSSSWFRNGVRAWFSNEKSSLLCDICSIKFYKPKCNLSRQLICHSHLLTRFITICHQLSQQLGLSIVSVNLGPGLGGEDFLHQSFGGGLVTVEWAGVFAQLQGHG